MYLFALVASVCGSSEWYFILISLLSRYPTPQTRLALTDLIENEQAYYKVRCEACHCLAKVCTAKLPCFSSLIHNVYLLFSSIQVANAMVSNWSGPPAMLNIFRKFFGSFSCPNIVKHNDFSNLQQYFLQKVSYKNVSSCSMSKAL